MTTPEPNRRLGCLAWLGGAALLAVLALFGLAALGRSSADDPPTASERRTDFVVNCERAVRDSLKAPASAQISNAFEDGLLTTASGFAWNGTVDAQNSFGANLRTAFRCQGPPENPSVTFQ